MPFTRSKLRVGQTAIVCIEIGGKSITNVRNGTMIYVVAVTRIERVTRGL